MAVLPNNGGCFHVSLKTVKRNYESVIYNCVTLLTPKMSPVHKTNQISILMLIPGDTLFLLTDKDRFLILVRTVAILPTSLQELLIDLLAVILRLVWLTRGGLHQLLVSHWADCVGDIP